MTKLLVKSKKLNPKTSYTRLDAAVAKVTGMKVSTVKAIRLASDWQTYVERRAEKSKKDLARRVAQRGATPQDASAGISARMLNDAYNDAITRMKSAQKNVDKLGDEFADLKQELRQDLALIAKDVAKLQQAEAVRQLRERREIMRRKPFWRRQSVERIT